MQHTKNAIRRQSEPRWLLAIAVALTLLAVLDYLDLDDPVEAERQTTAEELK